MNPSKYLEPLQRTLKAKPEALTLTGSFLIVEQIPEPERKTKSGLVLADSGSTHVNSLSGDKMQWCRIIAVGAGYYDEATGKDVPLDSNPGDIILVGMASVKWLPWMDIADYKPYEIGITREEETQMRFNGGDGSYAAFFEEFNRST